MVELFFVCGGRIAILSDEVVSCCVQFGVVPSNLLLRIYIVAPRILQRFFILIKCGFFFISNFDDSNCLMCSKRYFKSLRETDKKKKKRVHEK